MLSNPTAPLSRAQRRAQERGGPKRNVSLERYLDRTKRARQSKHDRAVNEQKRVDNLPFTAPEHAGKIDMTFAPIVALLDSLRETGEVECLNNGTPIIRPDDDEHYYPLVGAMYGMCETYEKLARTHGWTDETDGLRKLAKRLEVSMPITVADVASARRTIEWMKERTWTITPAQFTAESIEVQIRAEMNGLDR